MGNLLEDLGVGASANDYGADGGLGKIMCTLRERESQDGSLGEQICNSVPFFIGWGWFSTWGCSQKSG